MRKKKILSAALAACMGLSLLTGCTGAAEEETTTDASSMTALELSKLMGNGINLGNTMEAYGRSQYGTTASVTAYETCWGQPVTTQEMIQGYKDAGFDSIRIPVAWTNTMNYEDGDYTISQDFIDRVGEIIGWAIDADMYVIINDHWDGGWWGMFGSADSDTVDQAFELYTSMWTQISEAYADYDYHLLFAGGNEEIGDRLNDEIDGQAGVLSEDECYEMAAKINQTFVDTVRATGGNNADRFLIIPGYNTDGTMTTSSKFVMPTDTAESKLFVEVHYYTPWNFCGDNTEEGDWGLVSEIKEMNRFFQMIATLEDQGYGVILGEHGPLPYSDGTVKEATVTFLDNLLDNCDIYNIVPFLWDINALYSKTDCALATEDLAELYASRNYEALKDLDEEEYIQSLKDEISAEIEAAPTEREVVIDYDAIDGSTAWIMWNGTYTYSVGDTYNPSDCSEGVVATDAEITGEGTYTISLDFTGTEYGQTNSITFAAIGLSWGEVLYPGYYIENIQIKVNGEDYPLTADYYTTADDKVCTRVNLINEWVDKLPDEARRADGDLSNASPVIIDKDTFVGIETLEITFDYVAP